MPEPKENPQATPTDPRVLWERAVDDAQRERRVFSGIVERAYRTGREIRELLQGQRGSRPYYRFYLDSTSSEMVIQTQTAGRMDISFSGACERAMQDLATHYPSATHSITQQGNTLEVRMKSNGILVARAHQNNSPRFLRAILAYNQVVDGGTLVGNAGFEQASMTTILCPNPELIVTSGNMKYNIREYLQFVHKIEVQSHPRWPDVTRVETFLGEYCDVITDARTLRVLSVLRPLAQRASRDAAARQTLRDHLRHIDLSSPAWRVLVQDFLAQHTISADHLSRLERFTPNANHQEDSIRDYIEKSYGTIAPSQWHQLEEIGLVDIPPPANVRDTGLEVERRGEAVQMVVRGDRGSIDVNAEWLTPIGCDIINGNCYEYDPRGGHIVLDTNRVQDRHFVITAYHEIGHANDPNFTALHQESGRLRFTEAGLADEHADENNYATLIRRFMLLRRREALINHRLESHAWGDALNRARDTRRRTGQDIVRNRFQNCTQFVGRVLGVAYLSYRPGPNNMRNMWVPGRGEPHIQAFLQFGQNLYRTGDFAENCRLYWAEGEAETIATLMGVERQKAIELFNFRYGPFTSKKFHPLKQCGDGRYLAINEQGMLYPYENEQAFKAARDAAPVEAAPITTRWWTGLSPAERIANHLEHFHRFANNRRAFDLTFDQLDILERTLLGRGGQNNIAERISTLRTSLSTHDFIPKQIDFLLYSGFFGQDIADHLRITAPQPDLQDIRQRVAAMASLDDFSANQQRYRNPQGEPSFTALRPAEQRAITDAIKAGAQLNTEAEARLRNIRRILTPPFTPGQCELMIMEGHFDRPGENILSTRARGFTDLNLRTLPLYERIWLRGGLDTNNTSMADIVKVAQDLKIDVTNLTDTQRRQKVEETINSMMGRRG